MADPADSPAARHGLITGMARVLLLAAMGALPLLQLVAPQLGRGEHFALFAGLQLAATAAYLVLGLAVVRGWYAPRFAPAFGLALVLRALMLPLEPGLSDDVWRYLFEGRLVLEGHNPYLTPPDDPAVAHLRDAGWERINNKSVPAAYPPAMQLATAGAVWLVPGALGMRLLFGLCDLLTFVALWRWLPRLGIAPQRALLHGCCPLVVLEYAGEAHGDSLAVLFMVLAFWAASARRGLLAGTLLGIATGAKLLPAVFLPFIGRRGVAAWVGFAVVLAALYAPFAAPPGELLRGTLEYASRWRANDTLYSVIHAGAEWLVAQPWYPELDSVWLREPQRLAKLPLLLLGGGLLVLLWLRRLPAEQVAAVFFVFFVLAAPTLHPWYVGFLVPFLCLHPNPGFLLFTGTVYLSYHVLPAWLAERVWEERTGWKIAAHLPLWLGVLGWLWTRARAATPDDARAARAHDAAERAAAAERRAGVPRR